MITRYRLDFEYKSPHTQAWVRSVRDADDIEELLSEWRNQQNRYDVRNSKILKQEISDWEPTIYS